MAAVYWARVETVVVVPPAPPLVPPLRVAYPRLAASLMVARFSMVLRSSSSTVGVGTAMTRPAKARAAEAEENFMLSK